MKKALLLLALPFLFLTACDGGNNSNSGTTPKTDPSPSQTDPEPATPSTPTVTTTYMTTINPGSIYFDFNLTTPIEGLKIKVDGTEITQSGLQTIKKNKTYEVEGTPSQKFNYYAALEWNSGTGASTNTNVMTGVDASKFQEMVGKYLNKYAAFEGDYRIYVCITDVTNGWSKTIPGVDDIFIRPVI